MNQYNILLYYCYTHIQDPRQFREDHHYYCLELDLRGRIIVAGEGLNGTVSGLVTQCDRYMQHMKSDPRFKDIEFKVESFHQHAFQKLNVRVKSEIVNVGLPHIDPKKKTGIYVDPQEFAKIKDSEEVVLLDVRSNYEHRLGKFKNAVTLDLENFRNFPEKLDELKPLKNKKIITYCTGGIKCEKASAFLLENGFENVYQLHGGIINYGLTVGGKDFEGKCYVFDKRVGAEVNKVNPTIASSCYICSQPSDHMVNCANPTCNLHITICPACGEKMEGACSPECQAHPQKRPYDGTGYYQKELNGYNPYRGINRKPRA